MPMEYASLREAVHELNLALSRSGLVTLTWGDASMADRRLGVFGIKPSGVAYDRLRPEDIVVLSLEDGRAVAGTLQPPTDAPAHLILYRHFEAIQGVIHTHSTFAVAWAQAGRELPCLGTTHAAHFRGAVPLVPPLSDDDIAVNYATHVGASIVNYFAREKLDPLDRPAALVPGHGPFVWGATPREALDNAIALEMIAQTAAWTLVLRPKAEPINPRLTDLHFSRKYGQFGQRGQWEGPSESVGR